MLHAKSCAQPHAISSWSARVLAALALAAGVFGAATEAPAQTTVAALGVYRPSINRFFIDGNYDRVADLSAAFGQPGDLPVLGDLTGDGSKALGVYRNGIWYFDRNRDGTYDFAVPFGIAGMTPMVGDMNNDGVDDLVLFYNGVWYVSYGGTGTLNAAYVFGVGGMTPMLADLDGDGKLDLVLYLNGVWYGSTRRDGVTDRMWVYGGTPGEIPLAFDYDGDGIADLAVVRNGVWYVTTTHGPYASAVFAYGVANDVPLYYGRGATSNPRLDAARLLYQTTFGPTEADINAAISMGATAWVDDQLNKPASTFTPYPWWPNSRPQVTTNLTCTYPAYAQAAYNTATPCNCSNATGFDQCQRDLYTSFQIQSEFFRRALTAPDQLRLRTAWALSQILVTSAQQDPQAYPMRDYFQMLVDNAFGRYETLLANITLSPWMGNYLDMVNNAKGDPTRGTVPNENFARELMQLFSIGLWELNPDGTLLKDANGNPIPSYDQQDITELSRVLTGWTYPPVPGTTTVRWNSQVTYKGDMMPCEGSVNCQGTTNYHDTDTTVNPSGKTVLGVNFNGDARSEALQTVALMASHPNIGPFISKQLIQQLVTGNPTPAYVQRVVAVWNNNGAGIRGDLRAVVRAILLDPEARAPRNPVASKFGKLKEPVLYVTSLLRALGATSDGVSLRAASTTQAMGQNVFNSPTVFNYYTNGYFIPGTTLEGPPFEIYDATLYFARVNYAFNLIYNASCDTGASWSPAICGPNPDPTVAGATGTKIDWTIPKVYADDPNALANWVNTTFFHGTMPQFVKTNIIKAVSAVTLSVPATQQQRLDRARMAVYLAVASQKFQVEH